MEKKRGGFVPIFKITSKTKIILEFAKKNKDNKNIKEIDNKIMELL